MTHETVAVGAYGERVAAAHLVAEGMAILDRNWRCPAGEIDIVARDRGTVVFVEVKTRRGEQFGFPSEAVIAGKVKRLRQLAVRWLMATGVRPGEIRFDVVSVLHRRRGSARVHHLRDAF